MPAIMLCVMKATNIFAMGSKICVTGKVEERDFESNFYSQISLNRQWRIVIMNSLNDRFLNVRNFYCDLVIYLNNQFEMNN